MLSSASTLLRRTNDAAPVEVVNPLGTSPFLFVADHAGNAIPETLEQLGLGPEELSRHIGWDIGIAEVGMLLSSRMDAVFVRQHYSRLVIDCNREPGRADAIPEVSDGTTIPGNVNLGAADREARVAAIHAPYQAAIADEIARRHEAGADTILVALHSFTPRMNGFDRPWQVGILHNGANDSFAGAMLAELNARGDLAVGDNEPYRMDLIDYTIPHHAFAAGLPYAEIEVRQDLIGSPNGVAHWGGLLIAVLNGALQRLG